MDSFSNLFQKEYMGQLLLCILFIIYLLMGYQTPEPFAGMIDSIFGKIIIIIIVISLFIHANPILAVLSLFVAFDLMKRSAIATGSHAMSKFLPSETKKGCEMSAYNFTPYHQFPYTLEQEIVKKMAPIAGSASTTSNPTYKPLLENLHNASNIQKS